MWNELPKLFENRSDKHENRPKEGCQDLRTTGIHQKAKEVFEYPFLRMSLQMNNLLALSKSLGDKINTCSKLKYLNFFVRRLPKSIFENQVFQYERIFY